ncbi:MAG TPA: NUDIX hydrolase [Patescibacteria group bacterium]|nr:NUDIX hydrolase [Patescibacteria group bacterium]
MNTFLVNVSTIIFDGKNRVLLGLRSPNEDVFPNLWGIPGGKVDAKDKTIEEGLKREVREEMGIEIKNTKLIKNNIRIKSDGQPVIYMIFRSEIASGVPEPKEDTVKVAWFEFDKISKDKLTPSTYDAIEGSLLIVP